MQNSSNSHRSGERAPADCYTVAEAASVLGYSESWIRQLCRARRIGHLKRNIREGVRWRRQHRDTRAVVITEWCRQFRMGSDPSEGRHPWQYVISGLIKYHCCAQKWSAA
jgi:hypothetical protein